MRPAVDSPTITSWPQRGDTERDRMGAEFPAGTRQSGGTQAEPTVSAPRSNPHSHRRRVAQIAVGVVVLVAMYLFVLPQIASYTAVWRVIQGLSWPEAAALLAATLVNLSTDPLPWIAVMPKLSWRRAFVVTQASTATTYVAPAGDAAGLAVTFAMLRGWGFSSAAVSVAVALTGTLNVLVELALPVVALGLLSLQHEQYPLLTTVATIGLVVFVLVAAALGLVLARPQYARRAGDAAARLANRALRILKCGPVTWAGDTVVRFRNDAIGVMGRRGPLLTAASIAGQLSVFGVLFASLRAVGVPASEVSLVEVFAAWSLVRLISAFPITPGDLGIIEVGLTGALVAFGGANAPVVAAVLVYRVLSTVPTLVLGAIAGLSWHRLDAPAASAAARP
jgi:uncharacterized membrane protein YbhN (UPF0104 family)